MALGFYSPFSHDFAGKGEYNVLMEYRKTDIVVLEVSFGALTTVVKLPWKFLTLIHLNGCYTTKSYVW